MRRRGNRVDESGCLFCLTSQVDCEDEYVSNGEATKRKVEDAAPGVGVEEDEWRQSGEDDHAEDQCNDGRLAILHQISKAHWVTRRSSRGSQAVAGKVRSHCRNVWLHFG